MTIRLAHVFSYAQLFRQIPLTTLYHRSSDVKHVLMVHKLNLQCAVANTLIILLLSAASPQTDTIFNKIKTES